VPRPITKSRVPNFAGWPREPPFRQHCVMYPQAWIGRRNTFLSPLGRLQHGQSLPVATAKNLRG
jgi:hypothetical protein